MSTFDPREFRNTLGRFATGVCVITLPGGGGAGLGLTANSFSSVSLDPPLVLWSLQNNSDVYQQYATGEVFAINILSARQQELSNQYARKGDHVLDAAHVVAGESGAPLFRDALANFECRLHATHEAGDHLIIIGQVEHFNAAPVAGDASDAEPLLFYSGAYRQFG